MAATIPTHLVVRQDRAHGLRPISVVAAGPQEFRQHEAARRISTEHRPHVVCRIGERHDLEDATWHVHLLRHVS